MSFIIKINNEEWPTWSSENKIGQYIGVDSFAKTPFPTNEFPKIFVDEKKALSFINKHEGDSLFKDATITEV